MAHDVLLVMGGLFIGAILATFAYSLGDHLAAFIREKAKEEEDAKLVQAAYDELRKQRPPAYQFYTRES